MAEIWYIVKWNSIFF